MPRKSRIDAPGALHHIIAQGIERCKIFRDKADRNNFLDRLEGRSLLCYWAPRDLGISMAELSKRLRLSLSGVSLSVKRGEIIARDNDYKLVEP